MDLQGKTCFGLCGGAARPAPDIVKHTRATQKNAHVENQTPHLTHKGKDNSTDGGGGRLVTHRSMEDCARVLDFRLRASIHKWNARCARANNSTDGAAAAPLAPPLSVLLFSLCVCCECWRSFVWHECRIYRIYEIYRICRVGRVFRLDRVYTVHRAYRIYKIVRITNNILANH